MSEPRNAAAPVGAKWCYRHQGPAERVIQGRVCVSCYNREREAIGCAASAKTKAKKGIRDLAAVLATHSFTTLHAGRVRQITSPIARDQREALEVVGSRISGGFVIGRPRTRLPGASECLDTPDGVVFGRRRAPMVAGLARQMELGAPLPRRSRGSRIRGIPLRPNRDIPIALEPLQLEFEFFA